MRVGVFWWRRLAVPFCWVTAACVFASGVWAAPAVVPDTLAQRAKVCTACHGAQGEAASDGYRPRIAGKPAGYLYHQLLNFRDGRRHYGPMVGLVDNLSNGYLRELAQHYAGLDLPYPPPVAVTAPGAVLARGRQLALQGDPALNLPACATCHGERLTGVLPVTPGLLGLSRDYLVAQLGAWLHGQRRAHAPDCMADVAQRLPAADITAVSTWLAGQAVPADSRPQSSLAAPAPLRCGSVWEPSR